MARENSRSAPGATPAWVITLAIFTCALVIDLHRIAVTLPRAQFGDEWRYLHYAKNLLAGFYSPRHPVFLWNGPGYPLFLVPFVKFGWVEGARYANAVFHALAITYAWLVLEPRVKAPWSYVAVGLLGLYPPTEEFLPLLYTEIPCFFLATAWVYHAIRSDESRTHTLIAGVYLGILTLVKVVFGYVLVAFLLVALAFTYWKKSRRYRAHALAAALALGMCVPYLAYSYSLTGRVFYWSSAGANSFYWLTSPYPEELGDWYHQGWVQQNPILRAHHLEIYEETSGLARDPNLSVEAQVINLSSPEAADAFMAVARNNVREHPLKFFKNWLYNLVRLFCEVPVSVRRTPVWNPYTQGSLVLLGFTAYVAALAARVRKGPPRAFRPVLMFAGWSFAAYSLSSAVARYLMPLVPLAWLSVWAWFDVVERAAARPLTKERAAASSAS